MDRIWFAVGISILSIGLFSGDLFASETVSEAQQLVESYFHGESTTYRSKGISKAQGLDVEFQIPKTWKESVTERSITTPNIVVFFEPESSLTVSSPGYISAPRSHLSVDCFQSVVLDELGVPPTERGTYWERMTPVKEERELAEEMFSDIAMREFYPSTSPILNFSNNRVKVDGWPGTIVSGRVTYFSERTGITSTMFMMTVCVLYKQYCFGFNISVAKDIGETELAFKQRYSIYKPLIQQIASTIVIHNQRSARATPKQVTPQKSTVKTSTEQQAPTQPYGVVVVKRIEKDLYLCRRNGSLLVVDCSEHSIYHGRELHRGALVGGEIIPEPGKTTNTMVNGKVETLPLVKLMDENQQ